MAIFREKASRDEMRIFLRFSKVLIPTYLLAKFYDLTHFQLDFKIGFFFGLPSHIWSISFIRTISPV